MRTRTRQRVLRKLRTHSGTEFSGSVHLCYSSCRMTSLGDGVTTGGGDDDKCCSDDDDDDEEQSPEPTASLGGVGARLPGSRVLIRPTVVVGRPAIASHPCSLYPDHPVLAPPVIGSCILILGRRRSSRRPFLCCKHSGGSWRAPDVEGRRCEHCLVRVMH